MENIQEEKITNMPSPLIEKCDENIETISGHLRKIRPCFNKKPCPIHNQLKEE